METVGWQSKRNYDPAVQQVSSGQFISTYGTELFNPFRVAWHAFFYYRLRLLLRMCDPFRIKINML